MIKSATDKQYMKKTFYHKSHIFHIYLDSSRDHVDTQEIIKVPELTDTVNSKH